MDFLECGICHIPYNEEERRPRHSPCGHEFCSICLKTLITDGEYVCPKCREKSNVNEIEGLPVSFGLLDVIRAFNANAISKTKENDSRVVGASNEDVCNTHSKPISDRCTSCQLWLCTACLNSHTSLTACSTIKLTKAVDDLKDNQNKTVEKLLNKFDEDTSHVESKIQEHSDKRKEYLEIAEKHGKEVNKLQQVLIEGKTHKRQLEVSMKQLNEIQTPHAVIDGINIVTQRKQALLSWSARNIETDTTPKAEQELPKEMNNLAKSKQYLPEVHFCPSCWSSMAVDTSGGYICYTCNHYKCHCGGETVQIMDLRTRGPAHIGYRCTSCGKARYLKA